MKPKGSVLISLLIVGIISFGGMAWGQDIKARMRARLPEILALKGSGVVGENNQGYLTILENPGDKKAVVEAENQDRRHVYQAIAKKKGTTPELVGQRRAIQIAQKAVSGTRIQGPNGKWQTK